MDILNIVDKLFSNKTFINILLIVAGVLVTLFLVIWIIGKIDKKKRNHIKEEIVELEEVSLAMPTEKDPINEDVTFEVPTLTENLENFKKAIEEEMNKDNIDDATITEVRVKSKKDETKEYKFIEDNIIDEEELKEKNKEAIQE